MEEKIIRQILKQMLKLTNEWTSYTPNSIEAKKEAFLELRDVLLNLISLDGSIIKLIEGELHSLSVIDPESTIKLILGDGYAQRRNSQD